MDAPGGQIAIYETDDVDRDLDDAIATGSAAPYGRVLWASAPCVAAVLARRPVEGRSVLELGCGTGLVALVAARLGAHVLATDVDLGALEATRRGALELGGRARVRVAEFDICGDQALPGGDVVVAADLLYEASLAASLATRALEALARGSTVIVGDPARSGRATFTRVLEAAGWLVGFAREEAGAFVADVLVLRPEDRA